MNRWVLDYKMMRCLADFKNSKALRTNMCVVMEIHDISVALKANF